MAKPEVTLLLGEQMAIIYLGVNIALPLILSAVLALITLLVVQLSRFFKKRMGSSSYSKVVTLTPIASEKSDVSVKKDDGATTTTTTTTATPVLAIADMKETSSVTVTGHGFVRKRRPSIISEAAASPEPIPSVSSEGSFTSRDHILPPSSRPSSAVSRIRRISSSNRISPETPPEDRSRTPTMTGAWTEKMKETNGRSISRMKRKNSDRVVSPSQCQMDGLEDDDAAVVNAGKRNSVFSDDMNVFEIW